MNIGSGWRKKDKNGETYLSIVLNIPLLGELRCLVYINKDKGSERQPDYTVVWLPERPNKQAETVQYFDNEEPPF